MTLSLSMTKTSIIFYDIFFEYRNVMMSLVMLQLGPPHSMVQRILLLSFCLFPAMIYGSIQHPQNDEDTAVCYLCKICSLKAELSISWPAASQRCQSCRDFCYIDTSVVSCKRDVNPPLETIRDRHIFSWILREPYNKVLKLASCYNLLLMRPSHFECCLPWLKWSVSVTF